MLADFAAFSAWVMWDAGLAVAFEQAFASPWSTQIAIDLALSVGAIMVWMHKDAKARGANPWPWLAVTLFTGSIGWLAYLVARPEPATSAQSTATSAPARASMAA